MITGCCAAGRRAEVGRRCETREQRQSRGRGRGTLGGLPRNKSSGSISVEQLCDTDPSQSAPLLRHILRVRYSSIVIIASFSKDSS